MSVSPKVTVLMAVYNGIPFLVGALQSVLRQTFTDFEFLIIDDGSTDESVAVIQACRDSRIRLVSNDSNQGLVASLNRGMELARGEYIARMDADDISHPERLKRQIQFMDTHPYVGVCGSWVRFFSEIDTGIWKLPEHFDDIRCWQFHTVGVAHPSVMLRRRFFCEHALRYDERYRYIEDFELWGRAMKYMQFANIPQVLLDYRIRADQICAVHGKEQQAAAAGLRLKHVRELGIEPSADEQTLHEMILNGDLPFEREYLDKAEAWLLCLERANRIKGLYVTECFSRRLLQLWFSTCVGSGEEVCSLWRCLRSPLWSTLQFAPWDRFRAIGAWVMRKRQGVTP